MSENEAIEKIVIAGIVVIGGIGVAGLIAGMVETVKPVLLCRMIGHRWTDDIPYSIGDARSVETRIHGCCLRCGEPTPEELTGHE